MRSKSKELLGITLVAVFLFTPIPALGAGSTGETCTVDSPADSGSGTLRWCLSLSSSGDTITFDPAVFAPASPVTITVSSALPHVITDTVVVDASNAGVILDGSGLSTGTGLVIASDGNVIKGLQILHFPNDGVAITGGAKNNVIGGDRMEGSGPMGEGNLISGNAGNGIFIGGANTISNTISGNYIGTAVDGSSPLPNGIHGVTITASSNMVGGPYPGDSNIIAFNNGAGVQVSTYAGNTVRRNSIYGNSNSGIRLVDGGNNSLPAPIITKAQAGFVSGTACAGCIVEVFSDEEDEGRMYEGNTIADSSGNWIWAGSPNGPYITATATDEAGNTSAFSVAFSYADLSVSKSDAPDPVTAGNRLNYAISVSNAGPSNALSVTLMDDMPSEIFRCQYSTNGGSNWSNWNGSLNLGIMVVGDSKKVLIRGTVAESINEGLSNTACVTSETLDPDTGNNCESEDTEVNEAFPWMLFYPGVMDRKMNP